MTSEPRLSFPQQVTQFMFTVLVIGLNLITYRLYSFEHAGILDQSQKTAFLGISGALGLLLAMDFLVGHALGFFNDLLKMALEYFHHTCVGSAAVA